MFRVANMFQKIRIFDSHHDDLPLFISLFLLVTLVLLNRYWKKRSHISDDDGVLKYPPGPWKLPLIGNLHQLAWSIAVSLPHHFATDLAKKYGDIMHLQVGQVSAILISSRELAEQVLRTQESSSYADRPTGPAYQLMSYNNSGIIASPCNEYWKEMRKISMLELLSPKRVASFTLLREEETQSFIQSIRDHISSNKVDQPINLTQMIYSLLNSFAGRAVLGRKYNHQKEFTALVQAANGLEATFNLLNLFPSFKLLHRVTRTKSVLEGAHRKTDGILEQIINDHKLVVNESAGEEQGLLTVLLQLQKSGESGLTTNQIKAVTLDVYAAASETSASTIEWAMAELVRNPKAMEKAQSEVRQLFAGKQNIQETDVRKLEYLKLVIQETLRLHPSLPLIPRQANGKCKVGGYDIPTGAKVVVNAWAMGRDPQYWGADADCFEPERFRSSSINFRGTNLEFIPFGAGKRMCPGIPYATAAIELPLSQLLYYFNWMLPDGKNPQELDMSETFGLTVRKRNELELIATPFFP